MDLVPPAGPVGADDRLAATDTRRTDGAARRDALATQFEAAMLTSFVEPLLPAEDSEMWGGPSGSLWRGLFAQEIAAEIAEAGGVGLADMVRPVLDVPANDNTVQAGMDER